MRFGHSEVCLEHDTGERHPEAATRIRAIRQSLSRKHGVEYFEAAPASRSIVESVHDPAYVESFREFCLDGGGRWDPDTVAVEATWDAALRSAGLARAAALEAVERPPDRAVPFAIGRPPGHHALPDDAMGFCFLNNVAIATQATLETEAVERVAILDWDVHHGNGTQEIFYDRDDVFFASVHEDGLYPGTGGKTEVGEGPGAGWTLNVPLQAGAADLAYDRVLRELFEPLLVSFDPDLLLISAGFDAHKHDPISRMQVSSEGYGHLADLVRDIAGRSGAGLGFVLEGGYSLDMLAEGVSTIHEVFHGRTPEAPSGDLDGDIRARIDDLRDRHDLPDR